jgi:hypothetical protein
VEVACVGGGEATFLVKEAVEVVRRRARRALRARLVRLACGTDVSDIGLGRKRFGVFDFGSLRDGNLGNLAISLNYI